MQIVRHLSVKQDRSAPITCNLLGPTAVGFRHRDDVEEITGLLADPGISVNVTAPLGASPAEIARLPAADFNLLLCPEIGESAARWLEKPHAQPCTKTVSIGVGATRDFIAEVARITGLTLKADASRLCQPWWTRSADSTYLTGKRVFIFGDGTDVAAAARIARDEMGFEGANVIFDTWIHPLVMGLEKHLLTMFRDDFEFHDAAGASHHAGYGPKAMERKELSRASGGDIFTQKNAEGSKFEVIAAENIIWLSDAGRALKKIPFFVRGKARRNTETFALQKGITQISIDTLYAAKAHYPR